MTTRAALGSEAIKTKGWVKSHQWLLLRRASQLSILCLFLFGGHLSTPLSEKKSLVGQTESFSHFSHPKPGVELVIYCLAWAYSHTAQFHSFQIPSYSLPHLRPAPSRCS